MEPNSQDRSDGLIVSLRRLANTFLYLLQTRLELLSTEVAEERFNLAKMGIVALAALFCLQTGIILAVLFFVMSVSDANRLAAVGIAAGVLLVLALIAWLWLRRWMKSRPPMFAATMDELRKDRERLEGKK